MMSKYIRIATLSVLIMSAVAMVAQTESAGGVRRKKGGQSEQQQGSTKVTDRMQSFYEAVPTSDADLVWMREVYRQINLEKEVNAPLYFPEDVVDGQENLFRLIFRLVVDGKVPAYEYLDGREIFTDKYLIKPGEMLDRFGIYYTKGRGDSFMVEESDVPTNQVLNYYILERWEFDKRTNRTKTRVMAICPVLNRIGDFGGETRYPMFWVKFDVLRPFLAQQYVFLTDDNNLAQHSLDDFFMLGMYQGDIYKTKNLRNLSMNQMFPDQEDLKAAQDSIDNRLRSFGKDLYVPSREEFLAQQEKAEAQAAEEGAELNDRDATTGDTPKKNVRSKKKKPKKSKVKGSNVKNSSVSSSSGAEKSVRRRKKR